VAVEPTLLERRLYEAFDVFDNARSGEVDVRDLGTIIRALGYIQYKNIVIILYFYTFLMWHISFFFLYRSIGCVITEAELQEIQVEVEDVENNCVPINRFVEYMSKAINERKYVQVKFFFNQNKNN